ncbi:Copia protein, partial [Bienertia sinuspersici]
QQLAEEENCCVTFCAGYCLIKENKEGKIKGVGRAAHGLYYLINQPFGEMLKKLKGNALEMHEKYEKKEKVALIATAKAELPSVLKSEKGMSKNTLWHMRLGHAPMRRIQQIKELTGLQKHCEDVCLTCPLAKFTKLPYKLSESRAPTPFALIHTDIWGPYRVCAKGKYRYFMTVVMTIQGPLG